MFRKIRELFRPEDIETVYEDAEVVFRDRRQDEIKRIEERKKSHREKVKDIRQNLKRSLDNLEGYQDPMDRAVIEDTVQDFRRKKKMQVENMAVPEDPEELVEELERFIEEFETMKKKKKMVLDQTGEVTENVFSDLRDLKEQKNQLEEFTDGIYMTEKNLEKVVKKKESIDRLENEIEELEEQLEERDLEKIREKIDEKKDELEKHMNKPGWDERSRTKKRLKEQKKKRKKLLSNIRTPLSKMERGLKKIVYSARNGDIDIPEDKLEILERLREGDKPDDSFIVDAVSSAVKGLDQKPEILGKKQRKKFQDAAEKLKSIDKYREEIEEAETNIENIEKELESFSLREKKNEIKDKIRKLEKKKEEEQKVIQRKRKEISSKRSEIKELKKGIQEIMNREFRNQVELRDI